MECGWTEKSALFSIGSMETAKTFAILESIAAQNSNALWSTIQDLIESGIEPETIFNDGIVEAVSNLLFVAIGGQPLYANQYIKFFRDIGLGRVRYLSDVIARRTEQFYASSNKKFMLQLIALEICL